MGLCRFEQDGTIRIGFCTEETIVPLGVAAEALGVEVPECDLLTTFLPGGSGHDAVKALEAALAEAGDDGCHRHRNVARHQAVLETGDHLAVSIAPVPLVLPIRAPVASSEWHRSPYSV